MSTDAEKIKVYEEFLHSISRANTAMNNKLMQKYVRQADAWSYAHRRGNGEFSEEEQQAIVETEFWRLGSKR